MKRFIFLLFVLVQAAQLSSGQHKPAAFINELKVSRQQFGNDQQWYIKNIPFFECSDPQIQEVYYYRWKLYKAHLKNLGPKGYIVTEFLNEMGWDLKPYNSLNDATGFHLYEGRWLKDPRYVTDYINYMYQSGGNDRHFSEAIADAAYACYLINPDKDFILSQLSSMIKIYTAWNDHFDTTKGLYYIEPLLDATEYTISSIDASGGKDGFRGGDSFRPSINSYMYANALAIANIAELKHDSATAAAFTKKATAIKDSLQKSLWNDQLIHFTDRYKVSNKQVKYWDFIRGRELVGMVPWTYNLPDDNALYNSAWKHVLNDNELKGKYGLRTNEPSYPYYMKQYRYFGKTDLRECQWNGPSWPFQTSQVLLGMANLLNNYQQQTVTVSDYFQVLKQYALQHYLQNGQLSLVEDYDPDQGGPIVNLNQRSEHYNHSEFNDLIITGLCGVRPSKGDDLVINPLIDAKNMKYLCLQGLSYHGYLLDILYDQTGEKYQHGKGLFIFADGRLILRQAQPKKSTIRLKLIPLNKVAEPVNLAVNVYGRGFPMATVSFSDTPDGINMANDGRIWYFDQVRNYWSSEGSPNQSDWYVMDFNQPRKIKQADLYFYGNAAHLAAPKSYQLSYWDGTKWKVIPGSKSSTPPIVNTQTKVNFKTVTTSKLKITFTHADQTHFTALGEVEVY